MKEYTIKEAAEILEVSKSTVRRRIKAGNIEAELKSGPYGKQYYISEKELDQVVSDRKVMEVKEVSQPINKEQFLKELKNAVEADLSNEIEQAENTISESIERQNEVLMAEISELKEEIAELKQQQTESLWNKIKNLF